MFYLSKDLLIIQYNIHENKQKILASNVLIKHDTMRFTDIRLKRIQKGEGDFYNLQGRIPAWAHLVELTRGMPWLIWGVDLDI